MFHVLAVGSRFVNYSMLICMFNSIFKGINGSCNLFGNVLGVNVAKTRHITEFRYLDGRLVTFLLIDDAYRLDMRNAMCQITLP